MGLSNFDIIKLARYLQIPEFRGVFMRDTLPSKPQEKECGIVNFNTSFELGSHWVAYYKDSDKRIYFDSFGQVPPTELQKYLKTEKEFLEDKSVIQRQILYKRSIRKYVDSFVYMCSIAYQREQIFKI